MQLLRFCFSHFYLFDSNLHTCDFFGGANLNRGPEQSVDRRQDHLLIVLVGQVRGNKCAEARCWVGSSSAEEPGDLRPIDDLRPLRAVKQKNVYMPLSVLSALSIKSIREAQIDVVALNYLVFMIKTSSVSTVWRFAKARCRLRVVIMGSAVSGEALIWILNLLRQHCVILHH